jgi:hypothetical protein
MAILDKKNDNKKKVIVLLVIVVIPLALKLTVALINNIKYGVPIVNDRTEGFYAKVAADLNIIKPNTNDEKLYRSKPYRELYYTIYVSTIKKALLASPTLKTIESQLLNSIQNWAKATNQKNGQPTTDHMLWALRDGAMAAGHYNSLKESQTFYENIHKELQESFKSGRLEKRGLLISPLLAPLQEGDLTESVRLMPLAISDVLDFKGINSAAVPSAGSKSSLEKFSLLSGENYLSPSITLFCSGWAFAKDNKLCLTADLFVNKNVLIKNILFLRCDDVFKFFGNKYKNAEVSRFNFEIETEHRSGFSIKFFDNNGELFREIPLDKSSFGKEDSEFAYCIDSLIDHSFGSDYYKQFVDRANFMIGLYQKLIPVLGVFSFISYLIATYHLLKDIYNKTIKHPIKAYKQTI